jgi:hypothetical protein
LKSAAGHQVTLSKAKTADKNGQIGFFSKMHHSIWKAKLESAYSFMLKYSKITVWSLFWTKSEKVDESDLDTFLGMELNWKYLLKSSQLF